MTKQNRKRVTKETRTNAINLRRHATGPEQVLWNALRARQLTDLKLRRQHPIESFVVDFFCADAKLIIEIDGESHEGQQKYDNHRERELTRHGFHILRFTNDEVLENLDGLLETIASVALTRRAAPSPSPSPVPGEGDDAPEA